MDKFPEQNLCQTELEAIVNISRQRRYILCSISGFNSENACIA
jgi:hypothetical protein